MRRSWKGTGTCEALLFCGLAGLLGNQKNLQNTIEKRDAQGGLGTNPSSGQLQEEDGKLSQNYLFLLFAAPDLRAGRSPTPPP